MFVNTSQPFTHMQKRVIDDQCYSHAVVKPMTCIFACLSDFLTAPVPALSPTPIPVPAPIPSPVPVPVYILSIRSLCQLSLLLTLSSVTLSTVLVCSRCLQSLCAHPVYRPCVLTLSTVLVCSRCLPCLCAHAVYRPCVLTLSTVLVCSRSLPSLCAHAVYRPCVLTLSTVLVCSRCLVVRLYSNHSRTCKST